MNDIIKIYWYHKNLKAWGFKIFGQYFDITFPYLEGWGWKLKRNWKDIVRIFWKRNGKRHWLYLPSFHLIKKPSGDKNGN